MKKWMFTLSLAFLAMTLFSEEHPMNSFMGQRWGVDGGTFKYRFEDAKKLEMYSRGYFLFDYFIGDIQFKSINFIFKAQDKSHKKMTRKNARFYQLHSVALKLSSASFEDLMDVFKMKYGEPLSRDEGTIENRMGVSFDQVEVSWQDKSCNRMITGLKRSENIDECRILLSPINDPDADSEEMQKKREVADKI